MDLDKLAALLELLAKNDVNELTYRDAELSLKVKLGAPVVVQHVERPVAMAAPAAAPPPPAPAAASAPAAVVGGHVIESPMVGTLYLAPAPGAPSFVAVGSKVQKGKPLCIIEAMKLMNEIESDVDGTVVEILVENGKPVQFGQALFRIQT